MGDHLQAKSRLRAPERSVRTRGTPSHSARAASRKAAELVQRVVAATAMASPALGFASAARSAPPIEVHYGGSQLPLPHSTQAASAGTRPHATPFSPAGSGLRQRKAQWAPQAGPSAVPGSPVAVSAASAAAVVERPPAELPLGAAALTYLEGNSWVLQVGGVRCVVDPIIEGPLDFGIPWLYKAFKKTLRALTVEEVLEDADCVLITQSLDDHCHLNTLRRLASLRPDVRIIATPNAQPLLDPLFKNVTYIAPGESATAAGAAEGASVTVVATAGPVLGPPWQRPENGYILRPGASGGVSVYLEPHCGYNEEELQKQDPVDVVVTPVVKQELPAFTLVSGQEDAVRLAKALRPKYIVPMANAELDASGILSVLVTPTGTLDSFQSLLQADLPGVEVKDPTPGKPLCILPK